MKGIFNKVRNIFLPITLIVALFHMNVQHVYANWEIDPADTESDPAYHHLPSSLRGHAKKFVEDVNSVRIDTVCEPTRAFYQYLQRLKFQIKPDSGEAEAKTDVTAAGSGVAFKYEEGSLAGAPVAAAQRGEKFYIINSEFDVKITDNKDKNPYYKFLYGVMNYYGYPTEAVANPRIAARLIVSAALDYIEPAKIFLDEVFDNEVEMEALEPFKSSVHHFLRSTETTPPLGLLETMRSAIVTIEASFRTKGIYYPLNSDVIRFPDYEEASNHLRTVISEPLQKSHNLLLEHTIEKAIQIRSTTLSSTEACNAVASIVGLSLLSFYMVVGKFCESEDGFSAEQSRNTTSTTALCDPDNREMALVIADIPPYLLLLAPFLYKKVYKKCFSRKKSLYYKLKDYETNQLFLKVRMAVLKKFLYTPRLIFDQSYLERNMNILVIETLNMIR